MTGHLATSINSWLESATKQLSAAGIPSTRLDAELILAYALEHDRVWVIAHRDEPMTKTRHANALLKKRLNRVPLAYITGHKEFYGRDFVVTPDVLVPRPESEMMIDVLKELWDGQTGKVIDVGTGSGCLGITATLEIPGLSVWLSDVSEKALDVAKQNAQSWGLQDQQYFQSDLLSAWYPRTTPKPFASFILANLPYVDPQWERSPETDYEPSLALFADDEGLELIKKLVTQAEDLLVPGGYLLLEADPRQYDTIISFARKHGFKPVRLDDFILTLQRV